jgi:hypothetical protein
MPAPASILDAGAVAFFDHLALLTAKPDEALPELRRLAQSDERVRVPQVVFNALLGRAEPFGATAPSRP